MSDSLRDFGDWVSQRLTTEIIVRFATTEDGVYGADQNYNEELDVTAYKEIQFSLPSGSSTNIGNAATSLQGFFLSSDEPLDITMAGSTFEDVTFMYVRLPDGGLVDVVGVANNSGLTATISVLVLEGS